MNLLERDTVINAMQQSMSNTTFGLSNVPGLLKAIIREKAWKKRQMHQSGQIAEFNSFAEFVQTPIIRGLGSSIDQIKRLCSDDPEALDLIDGALQRPAHRPQGSGLIQSTSTKGKRDRSGENIRRLRKDFAADHAEVIDKKKSVNKAAVEAGIYPRRISINLCSPDSAAQAIRKHADPEYVATLIELLAEYL